MLPTITLPRVDTGPFVFGNRAPVRGAVPPDTWDEWATTLFPHYCVAPFAQRHAELWQWAEQIEPDEPAPAFFAVWPRESAKSTSAQMVAIYLGGECKRRYVWYISETQAQANDHVTSLASMLTSDTVARYYPQLAERELSKFGHSRAWRQTRLWTAHGLIIDAVGLDVARRGVKIEEKRPDLMILDDIDNEQDKPEAVEKKIATITKKLLPAGSDNLAVLIAQNLVHSGSVVSRLVEGHETFLHNRIVSGPFKVVDNLKTENIDGRDTIIEGTHTWDGQSLAYAQQTIDTVGLPAFLSEYQNEVGEDDRLVFKPSWWDIEEGRNRYHQNDVRLVHLDIRRFQFWDTALKDKDTNDYSACSTFDLLPAGFGYKLVLREVWEKRILGAHVPDAIVEQALRWNGDKKLKEIIVEDTGSGTVAVQSLRATAPREFAGKIKGWGPKGNPSKEERAKTASVWCPRNMVLLPYPSPEVVNWYTKFCNHLEPRGQLFRFPFAPHDDMVDTFSMAILYLENYLKTGWQASLGTRRDLDGR